jgi:hypothetical protein
MQKVAVSLSLLSSLLLMVYATYLTAVCCRAPMMPNYNKLIDNNPELKVLVFSGDDDAVCATTGRTHYTILYYTTLLIFEHVTQHFTSTLCTC